jgi:hypothetical protein
MHRPLLVIAGRVKDSLVGQLGPVPVMLATDDPNPETRVAFPLAASPAQGIPAHHADRSAG